MNGSPRPNNGHQQSDQAGFLQGLADRSQGRPARSWKTLAAAEVLAKGGRKAQTGKTGAEEEPIPGIVLGPANLVEQFQVTFCSCPLTINPMS